MTTYDRIKNELEKKGLSGNDLAKACGFSSGLWSQWKSGKQKPSADKVIQCADYLGCSVDYLLGRETKPVETDRDTLAAILRQLPESDIDELIHFAEFLLAKQQRQAEPKDQ